MARRRLCLAAAIEMIEIEPRVLFCAGGSDYTVLPPITNWKSTFIPNGTTVVDNNGASTPAAAGSPLSSVPVLNSDPGAPATLYLDFAGAAAQTWGSYNVPVTPAFDRDGDATTFSDAELDAIREIFARVSEAYSPFNLNVTTVDPGNLNDRQTLKVVVGGTGAWLGQSAGGVSYVGSFANSAPNLAFAFANLPGYSVNKYVADVIEHESGHGFGLQHQSQ
jgi:hypothetical protein